MNLRRWARGLTLLEVVVVLLAAALVGLLLHLLSQHVTVTIR